MSILEKQLKSTIRYLHAILVLSIIGSGMMLLNSLFMTAWLPMIRQAYESNLSAIPVEMQAAYDVALDIPRICYVLMTLLYALSFTGVILMWKLRTNGWHCYTLAQLLLLVIPVLFMGKAYLSLGDIMMTALFVFVYFFALKEIRKLKELIEAEQIAASQKDLTTDIEDDSHEDDSSLEDDDSPKKLE